MYFETYSGERYFAFFGAVSKCEDFFGITIGYKLYNISKIMIMYPIFPDHQKCYFKEAFQNKTIILMLSFTGL